MAAGDKKGESRGSNCSALSPQVQLALDSPSVEEPLAWLLGFCEWRDTVITMRLSRGTRVRWRSVMGSMFTNIAFDALNCGSRDHRNGLRAFLDRDPIRILEPVTVGLRILDSLGRSGHRGILEINLDHVSLCIIHPGPATFSTHCTTVFAMSETEQKKLTHRRFPALWCCRNNHNQGGGFHESSANTGNSSLVVNDREAQRVRGGFENRLRRSQCRIP